MSAARYVVLALCWCIWAGVAAAQTAAKKPRVPPGVDPGGIAVAIIGNGIDYIRPEIARRLARDGEGQLFGWDFVDNDRLPYDACVRQTAAADRCPTETAADLLRLAPAVRLIVIRASASRPQALVQAMLLIAQSPARTVLIDLDAQPELVTHFLEDAAARFPDVLLIAAQKRIERRDPASPMPANLLASQDPAATAAAAVRQREQNPAITIQELVTALSKP